MIPSSHAAIPPKAAVQLLGAATSAGACVWLVFHLAGLHAPLGRLVAWLVCFAVIYGSITWQSDGALLTKSRLAALLVYLATSVAFLPLVAILGFIAVKGWPAVSANFPHFFIQDMSRAGPLDPYSRAGMANAIVGTIEQVGLATAMTAPVALLAAVYLSESRSRIARSGSIVIDAVSGVPAIIAGLFVYLLWVQPRHTSGYSGFAASLAISIVMIPTITRTAQEVLVTVPVTLREASFALGANRWRTTLLVVVPTARSGIATAVILGMARAVGETAPVLFTAHGALRTNFNPFRGPQADLPLQVFTLVLSSNANQTAEAWGGAFVLVLVVLVLFVSARVVGSGGLGGLKTWALLRAGRGKGRCEAPSPPSDGQSSLVPFSSQHR